MSASASTSRGDEWNAPDSDDEVMQTEEYKKSGKTTLVVIIESTVNMFRPWHNGGESGFKAAITCCYNLWKNKVVSGPNELLSIILVGTENYSNTLNVKNVWLLQDMSTVTVDKILRLAELKDSDMSEYMTKIGTTTNYNMKDAFWLAKILFEDGNTATFTKKIMYFTCEYDPHCGNVDLRDDTIKRFKDLGKVELSLVAFKPDFDFNKFYSKIMTDKTAVYQPTDMKELVTVVRKRQKTKRPISRSTLELGPGVKLGIGFYSFVRPAPRPRYTNINMRNNQPVRKEVSRFHKQTGDHALKTEEVRMVEVKGETSVFTDEEIRGVKYIHDTGIKILGFMSKSQINFFKYYRSPAYFIYPDDDRISGSIKLFSSILKNLIRTEQVAIVRMVLSRGRSPKLACLVPSSGEEKKGTKFPQGFHVFNIPFSDEIRKLDFTTRNVASDELIQLFGTLIKKFTNKSMDISDIQNPDIHHKWAELEQVALDLEEPEALADFTVPNEPAMAHRGGEIVAQINNHLGMSTFDAPSSSSAPRAKKGPDMDVNLWDVYKQGKMNKLTVATLKAQLDALRVKYPEKALKQDLVNVAERHVKSTPRPKSK